MTDGPPRSLERLGHPADARLVIISCDDLGLCHAANVGVHRAMRDGAATCASLMVPAPWSRHAAAMYEPGDDIGVHLTLNAEHANYRWGPITHAPSLLSGDGGFPRSIDDLWEHADPEEVRRECRAQIERALAWGIDVTHLAPHLTAITLRPEFFDVYLDMAVEFAPADPPAVDDHAPSRPASRSAAWPPTEGVVFPDHFDHDWRAGSRDRVLRGDPRPRSRASPRSTSSRRSTRPEVRALSPAAEGWIDDLALVVDDPKLPALLAEVGAVLIGYSELRDVQRAG